MDTDWSHPCTQNTFFLSPDFASLICWLRDEPNKSSGIALFLPLLLPKRNRCFDRFLYLWPGMQLYCTHRCFTGNIDFLKSPSSCLFSTHRPLATSSLARPLRHLKKRSLCGLTSSIQLHGLTSCGKFTALVKFIRNYNRYRPKWRISMSSPVRILSHFRLLFVRTWLFWQGPP